MAGSHRGDEELAVTPAFSMQRAATPPIYAAPARADFPCERLAHLKPVPAADKGIPKPVPSIADALPPEPEVSQFAWLIVVAVIWLTTLLGIIAGILATRAYVTYTPPTPPAACVVAPNHECRVESVSGPYTLYYVPWDKSVGLASPTPQPKEGTP